MDVNVMPLARRLTLQVRVTGTTQFRVRLWLTRQVLRVLGWVAPFRVEVETCL